MTSLGEQQITATHDNKVVRKGSKMKYNREPNHCCNIAGLQAAATGKYYYKCGGGKSQAVGLLSLPDDIVCRSDESTNTEFRETPNDVRRAPSDACLILNELPGHS